MAMTLLVALMSAFALTTSASPAIVVGSNDDATAARWVKVTNTYRCMNGVGKVGWSKEVAAEAQNYVDTLTAPAAANSRCIAPPAGPAGENQAQLPGSDLEKAVASWYAQGANCGTRMGCEVSGNGLPTSYFTALVWKGVTQIGCAINVNASIYICRYKSGDNLGPQSANMVGAYPQSVLPKTKDLADCESEASADLYPSDLPDPVTLYPNFPQVSGDMSRIFCQGEEGLRPGELEHDRTIATWLIVTATICCCLGCCYACRFISKKEKGLPGTLSNMSGKHSHASNEEWRFHDYEEGQEKRVGQYTMVETVKSIHEGFEHSGIFK